jgi:hypothetical protein
MMKRLYNFASSIVDWLHIERGWQPHTAIREVTLVDGEKAGGFVMRKRVPGAWVYRTCTEDELRDHAYWYGIR